MPDEHILSEMSKYNEELVKAGVLLDGGGLQPTARAARVRFSGRQRTVIEGPFLEAKELVAGYWLLECKSLAECIEWVKRCPNPSGGESEVEIRPLFGMEDFPAANTETIERNERILAQARAQS
jgi:hypothetical protein